MAAKFLVRRVWSGLATQHLISPVDAEQSERERYGLLDRSLVAAAVTHGIVRSSGWKDVRSWWLRLMFLEGAFFEVIDHLWNGDFFISGDRLMPACRSSGRPLRASDEC